jgi:ketosteroid isomerase-like protein
MRRAFLLAACLMTAAYVTPGQVPSEQSAGEDARAAVEANHRKFIGAFGKGDAAVVAALHAADARVLPQNARPVEGTQGIQAFWQGLMSRGARLVQLETLRLEARGELAYEVGDYIATTQSGPGQTVVHSGSYVVVWRREGGEWKVAAAIWNASRAAPGQ